MHISPSRVRILIICACIAQVAGFALAWTSWLPATFFMQLWPAGMDAASVRALAAPLRFVGAVIALPALVTLCYGLWQLARLAANAGRGSLFDLANIACMRKFAGAILLSTALSIIEVPLRALAWRAMFDVKAPLSVGVSGDQLLVMLMCGLFYMVVKLMHEGRRLAQENEGFV